MDVLKWTRRFNPFWFRKKIKVMETIELFSLFLETWSFDTHNKMFLGSFTNETFAVQGFCRWIEETIAKNPNTFHDKKSSEILINASKDFETIDTLSDFLSGFANVFYAEGLRLKVCRHRPNEIMSHLFE